MSIFVEIGLLHTLLHNIRGMIKVQKVKFLQIKYLFQFDECSGNVQSGFDQSCRLDEMAAAQRDIETFVRR